MNQSFSFHHEIFSFQLLSHLLRRFVIIYDNRNPRTKLGSLYVLICMWIMTQYLKRSCVMFVIPTVLPRGYMGVDWRRSHQTKTVPYREVGQVSFSVQGQSGADQSSRMPCLCLHGHWEKDLWDDTLWHSNNFRHLLLRKPMIREPNNICNNYRTDIGWHDYLFGLRWKFAYSDNSHLNVINTNGTHSFWCNWRNSALSEKNTDYYWTKVIVDHKTVSEVRRGLLYIVRGSY